jgi:hypothetical protein
MAKANRLVLPAPDGQKVNDLRFRERQTLRAYLTFADLLAGYGRHTPECPLGWPGSEHRCLCGWQRQLPEIKRLTTAVEGRFLEDFGMRPVLRDSQEFRDLCLDEEREDDGSNEQE